MVVVGLPPDDLAWLAKSTLGPDDWSAILRVRVSASPGGTDLPAVAGAYSVSGGTLRFAPEFPLDTRVGYRVVFDPTRLPQSGSAIQPWRQRPIELTIAAMAQPIRPETRVTRVYPNDVLLENQLRIYLHFSRPMSRQSASSYVRLLNSNGQVVEDAFLPLDVSLWNTDHTRYTLLFDPGRVKRGILPSQEMGRPLVAGKRYTLVVDREWRDEHDQPLVEAFLHEFSVAPAVLDPIVPADWRVQPPRAATRDLLRVTFPRALDHALAEKALFVTTEDGHAVDGQTAVNDTSTEWTFTPAHPWPLGQFLLGALPGLEDPAGNRVNRAFDFDPRRRGVGDGDAHAQARIAFTIAPARR